MGDVLNDFDSKGIPILRETLAKHLLNYDIKVSPENIVVFPGYLEALYTVGVSLLNHGANLYCMSGDMLVGMPIVKSLGANFHVIPTDKEGLIIDKFQSMIRPVQNMLYVNPVNSFPSGLTFSDRRMDEIIDTCIKYNVPILENDFLRDIWFKEPPKPLKARKSDHVIYLGTMANSYVTGVRLGWAVLPDYIIQRVCEVKMQMSSGNSSGSELVVNEIISNGFYYEFLDKMRKKLPTRVDKVNKILDKYLSKYARWNPDNVVYTVKIEFNVDIDINRVIIENPYFLMHSNLDSSKSNGIVTNALGMSIDDFENLISACADSVINQLR